ncbi:Mut7-C RNAse domain-containing protein [Fodinibius sp.]|uniref:Mut7-C RNAse domain-containing protein n=1 Tax=Fodinibius sp. TaxID=1872440 RepID=UPI00356AB6DB
MISVTLRFYGDLNELLFTGCEETPFRRRLPGTTSVKDLIEGCGVPHTEVDLILIDGEPADFTRLIRGGEYVSVYPFFDSMPLPEADRLQQVPSHSRFLADVNLGKLSRYLRMAGFDTAYRNDAGDADLIEQMQEELRVLLTRDRKLLMHKVVDQGYLPRSDDPAEQLLEVMRRFDLFEKVKPFSRCPHCNGVLQEVPKEEIIDRLEPLTKRHFDRFSQCPGCGQVYWAGSHRRRLDPRVRKVLN